MKMKLAVALLAACFASDALANPKAPPTPEEAALYADMRLLQAYTAEEKRAFIAEQLQFSDQEASAFWPVFEAHQAKLADLNRRRLDNILAYARAWNGNTLDDKTAAQLAEQALAIEEDETDLLRHTYRKLKHAIPATKAVSYLQLENKIRAAVRFEQALELPLLLP